VLGSLSENTNKPEVIHAIRHASTEGFISNLLTDIKNNSFISRIVETIFGDRLKNVTSGISKYADVSASSASSLLNVVTGTALKSIGQHATEHNLNSSGISHFLKSQKDYILSLFPAGLSLASLGLNNLFESRPHTQFVKTPEEKSAHKKEKGGFLKWLILLLLLLALIWLLFRNCHHSPPTIATNLKDTTATIGLSNVDSTAIEDSTAKVDVEVVLPSGKKLHAYKGGIEDKIVSFLQSDRYKDASPEELKDIWFSFDNVAFEFNSTKFTEESKVQLDNLKAILSEFPETKIKVGAYTDKKGTEVENLKLSQERANAIKAALASNQVIETEGYGEKFALVDENAPDSERKADRKIAVRFVK
jgi:outer membrane protein OmpA-like peptidoglycan-associated protein